jgi:Lsr2
VGVRQVVQLVDDLDGGVATETVRFALDGVDYQADLSEANAAALRALLGRYAEAGRQASRPRITATTPTVRRRPRRDEADVPQLSAVPDPEPEAEAEVEPVAVEPAAVPAEQAGGSAVSVLTFSDKPRSAG